MKKTLITLLTLILGVTRLFAQTATAPSGLGTSGSPWQIASLENLYWIAASNTVVPSPTQATRWAAYYQQTTDINASATAGWFYFNPGYYGWLPIGNGTTHFTGSYNGQGHKITGLYINRGAPNVVGLFGSMNGSSASISNLGVTGCTIYGTDKSGGLVGFKLNGAVTNCYSSGSVSGTTYVGGLIGYNNSTVTNSYSSANMTASYWYVGGLIGYNNAGSISLCYSNGSVTNSGSAKYTGGLVGYLYGGPMTNCYSTGNVTGVNETGGLVGRSAIMIQNCYSTGHVSGSTYNGGLVGIGGAATNSFWDTQTSGQTASSCGTGKTTVQMKTLSTFTDAGWDFEVETTNGTNNYWDMKLSGSINSGYPYLSWQDGTDVSLPVELTSFTLECLNSGILLKWSTESEIENLGFIIEKRPQESGNWTEIASYLTNTELEGHGSTTEKKEYQFIDKMVRPGIIYTYRLGDVDYSGKVTLHKEVTGKILTESLQIPTDFRLQYASPNPFNPTTTIRYEIPKSTNVTLTVYNMAGKVVKQLVNQKQQPGSYSVFWDASRYSSGVYIYQITAGEFQQVRKCLLIK